MFNTEKDASGTSSWRVARQVREGFTSLTDPRTWCSLFQPVLTFHLGLVHSLLNVQDMGEPERKVQERLENVLHDLLAVGTSQGTPEEQRDRRRLMRCYADILTAYAGLLRETSQEAATERQPSSPQGY